MNRAIRALAWIAAGFAVLALGLDAMVGALQPAFEPGGAEGVLRTFDADGRPHENRLVVLDDGGSIWIQSGHHFRGWYRRLLRNPEVELVRNGETRAYRAVPLDTPETESRVKRLLKERAGALRFQLIRALLLYADVKPVRLDPRGAESGRVEPCKRAIRSSCSRSGALRPVRLSAPMLEYLPPSRLTSRSGVTSSRRAGSAGGVR